MRTVVINNRAGLIIGQLPHTFFRDRDGNPKATQPPQPGKSVRLIPGVNLIDSKVLAELRKNEVFQRLFKATIARSAAPEHNPEKTGKPILEIPKHIGKEGEVPDEAPLSAMKAEHAKAIISETFDVAVLNAWMTETTDVPLRRALQSQIDLMNTGKRPVGAS